MMTCTKWHPTWTSAMGILALASGVLRCAGAHPLKQTPPETATDEASLRAGARGLELAASEAPEEEIPWWSKYPAGPYRLEAQGFAEGSWLLAMGQSRGHHHVAEGLLKAKVAARLELSSLGEGTESPSGLAPQLLDVLIARDGTVFALYGARVPLGSLRVDGPLPVARPPADFDNHPHGRHAFDHARHLYLECDVEGPLLNPEWGSARYSASLGKLP